MKQGDSIPSSRFEHGAISANSHRADTRQDTSATFVSHGMSTRFKQKRRPSRGGAGIPSNMAVSPSMVSTSSVSTTSGTTRARATVSAGTASSSTLRRSTNSGDRPRPVFSTPESPRRRRMVEYPPPSRNIHADTSSAPLPSITMDSERYSGEFQDNSDRLHEPQFDDLQRPYVNDRSMAVVTSEMVSSTLGRLPPLLDPSFQGNTELYHRGLSASSHVDLPGPSIRRRYPPGTLDQPGSEVLHGESLPGSDLTLRNNIGPRRRTGHELPPSFGGNHDSDLQLQDSPSSRPAFARGASATSLSSSSSGAGASTYDVDPDLDVKPELQEPDLLHVMTQRRRDRMHTRTSHPSRAEGNSEADEDEEA
jgi:hypothetical protein